MRELLVVAGMWGLALLVIYLCKRFNRGARTSGFLHNGNKPDAGDASVILYEHDPVTRTFVMDPAIPTALLIMVSWLLGFGLIAILSSMEGTLLPSASMPLTFLGSIADPVNWALCAPALVVFSRGFLSHMPHSVQYLRKNLLTEVKDEDFEEEVRRTVRSFNKRWITIVIITCAFIGSAIGFIDLGQRVEIYGMRPIADPVWIERLSGIGWTKAPTILGLYVVFALTVLVSLLASNFKFIFFTILLFRRLYRKFQSQISINPFHSDGCGGLAFAGWLALRMMVISCVAGLMGLNLVLRDVFVAGQSSQLYHMFILPAYLVVMPIVFWVPILDARRLLITSRDAFQERLNKLHEELLVDIYALDSPDGESRDAGWAQIKETTQRLDTLQLLLDRKLPTWPINIQPTLGFVTAYMAPILIPVFLKQLLVG